MNAAELKRLVTVMPALLPMLAKLPLGDSDSALFPATQGAHTRTDTYIIIL